MICENCKYHYIDELSFDYPQSCCRYRSETTEQWLKCNAFEYGDRYVEQLQQENEKLQHYKTLYQSLKKQKKELKEWLEKEHREDEIKINLDWKHATGKVLKKLEDIEQPKKKLLKPSHYDEDIDVEYELYKARKFIEEDKKRKFDN